MIRIQQPSQQSVVKECQDLIDTLNKKTKLTTSQSQLKLMLQDVIQNPSQYNLSSITLKAMVSMVKDHSERN